MRILAIAAFAAITALLGACNANAADKAGGIPSFIEDDRPPIAWTGVWGELSGGTATANVGLSGGGDEAALGADGIFGGIGLGGDMYIAPKTVVGAFARYDLTSLETELSLGGTDVTVGLDNLWSVAARVGFVPKNDIMFYALVGLAGAEATALASDGVDRAKASRDLMGLLLGGGIEAQLFGPVALKAEYNWISFEDEGAAGAKLEPDAHLFRAGAAWRF